MLAARLEHGGLRRARRYRLPAWRGRFSAAKAGSATQAKIRASPFSRFARAVSSASGSIATIWTSAAKLGAAAHLSEKSSALPSSTTRSARFARSGRAPSVASARPRGLSNIMAGAPVAASSFANRSRPPVLDICGPATIIGRFAAVRAERILAQSASPSAWGTAGPSSGHATALSSNRASSKSDGKLKCTGPRRPERTRWIASPISRPRVSTLPAVEDAFVTGLAISAWRNS
jgi:hypothetical protein